MAVLVIVSMRGPRSELLAACETIELGLGMPPGLLLRVLAPSDDGVVLVNLWANEDLRRASNDNPAHRSIVQASGLATLAVDSTVQRLDAARVDLAAAR
jgi:hypothetical protein